MGYKNFVRRPGASADKHFALVALQEALNHLVAFGGNGYLVYAVEASVAGQRAVFHAVLAQQAQALLVLHKEVRVAVSQLPQEPAAPRLEEIMAGAEYGREDIGGDAAAFQCGEVVEPEVVLHEECCLQVVDALGEAAHRYRQVGWQVADGLRLGVVLAHLVARW